MVAQVQQFRAARAYEGLFSWTSTIQIGDLRFNSDHSSRMAEVEDSWV